MQCHYNEKSWQRVNIVYNFDRFDLKRSPGYFEHLQSTQDIKATRSFQKRLLLIQKIIYNKQ